MRELRCACGTKRPVAAKFACAVVDRRLVVPAVILGADIRVVAASRANPSKRDCEQRSRQIMLHSRPVAHYSSQLTSLPALEVTYAIFSILGDGSDRGSFFRGRCADIKAYGKRGLHTQRSRESLAATQAPGVRIRTALQGMHGARRHGVLLCEGMQRGRLHGLRIWAEAPLLLRV